MTDYREMTLEAFTATAKPVSDTVWATITGEDTPPVAREAFTSFAEGEWVYYEHEGQFWPCAWWYPPTAKATREEAIADLFAWRCEFVA